jgi:hypothetical protein
MKRVYKEVPKKIQMEQAVQDWSDAGRSRTEEQGVYGKKSRPPAAAKVGEVCNIKQQMSLFQRPVKAT